MSLLGHVTQLENQLNETKVSLERAISEVKTAQKLVVRYDRLAMLGQMTSGVVHDLNNALSPVLAAAELLRPADFVAETPDALSLIRAGANHASHVLQQLQFFYRTDVSEAAIERVPVADVVQQSIQLTRFRWRDEALKYGVVIEVQTAIPDECFVHGNRTELVQVFTNLILNASQSMPDGGYIRILASNDQDAVSVVVSDDGTGMTPDERTNCFQPFFTTKSDGSGMGLSICRDSVVRQGGSIDVEPSVSGGCQFTLRFPQQSTFQSKPSIREAGGRRRVLLIDDDQLVRQSLAVLLETLGCSVRSTNRVELGLKAAREDTFELVLVDFGVHSASGGDAVSKLKEVLPGVPVVVISGWSESAIQGELLGRQEPDQIVEKPVRLGRLRKCLKRFDLYDDRDEEPRR